MKRNCTAFFALALAFVLLTVTGQLFGQSLTQPSPNLPPPPGTYISPSLFHQLYAAGIVIKDVSHSKFTQSQPPPPPGGTQIHSFNSEVSMMVSTDGGTTYNPHTVPNVSVSVRVTSTPSGDIGNTRAFDTEMLSLNIQGGSLPPGVMVRESPTLQSTGKTRISAEPDGTFKINSFFDIFTELSLDGGATWMPSTNGAAHMALQGDVKPPVVSSSDNVPPIPGHYVSPDEFHQLFANGVVIKDISHEGFLHSHPPPPDSTPTTDNFGSTVKMQVSTDGGQTFQGMEAPATVGVMMHKTSASGAPTRTFDTEMLQLDIQGGGLPPGVMIRESPTKQSTGKTSISQDPGGSYRIHSFFDVFTELSMDGGTTWLPSTNGSTRMEVEPQPPPIATTSPNVPPIPSQYVSPADYHAAYANGIIIKDVSHDRFLQNDPPPPPDSTSTHTFGSTVHMQVSTDGGNTFSPAQATGDVTVMVHSKSQVGQTRTFDTEMLQLNLQGPTFMIRESPTKQSLGKTTITTSPGPQFAISSFFDIFTEVSLDGGATWSPSVGDPVQMELTTATVTICGTKYEDLNGNGVKDAGEPGLAGWTVKATSSDGTITVTATTDAAGNYCLTVPAPMTFKVEEVLQPGWMQTGGQPYYTITTAANQNVTGIDFGNFMNGSICGTKFNDLNGNGVQDPGEPGLPGWQICITRQQAAPSPVFPTTGGTDFLGGTLATVNINFFPAYGGINTTVCAYGPTTVQRANPSGPTPADSMKTEITVLKMIGTLPLPFPNDTFYLRHVADRRSYGQIQGNSYPAISFFDVFYELEVPAMGKTFVNYQATNMSAGAGITTIPPDGQNYLGFNTYLVNKNDPTDTLGLIKTVNHCVGNNNNPGQERCNCPTKAPPNSNPPGSPIGTSCATTDGNGNYCFRDLPAGSYIVTEIPQAGWTQTSPNPPKIVLTSGSTATANFGNKQNNAQLCIFKYYDANHNNQRDAGEGGLPAGICFDVFDASNVPVGTICTDATSTACINVPPGSYTIKEQVPPGYSSSDPKGGIKTINVTGDVTIDWGNTTGLMDSTFRTASYAEWARTLGQDPKGKLKAIKCKPDHVEFKLNLIVPATPPPPPVATPFTNLKLGFNMAVQINGVWHGKAKQVPITCPGQSDTKLKVWSYNLSGCVAPGDTIQFDGIGLKGAILKVAYLWANTDPKPKKLPGALTPLRKGGVVGDTLKQILRLPMPNLVNVGEELQRQLPFPFTTGAASGGHSVIYLKYNDVQKSLVKVTRGGDVMHTGNPRWLDVFDKNGAASTSPKDSIRKQQKGLPPDKHNNVLYGEALALQLNIMASKFFKFPAGFGSLVWNDPAPSYCAGSAAFNGKSVDSIMSQINQYLATGVSPKPGATAADYYCVAYWLNRAFNCPIDTIHWSCDKILLKGCTTLKDVPYLTGPHPGSVPDFTAPAYGPSVQYTPPDHYELQQNYPNPFNPTTTIAFELPQTSIVTLEVYNTLGQKVAMLIDHQEMEDGAQEVEFDASGLSSGIYFYKLTATMQTEQEDGTIVNGQSHVIMKKMMLIK